VRDGSKESMHQGNSDQLLGATFFLMISPAKFGRLVALNFCEVATGLLKATSGHFPPLIGAFDTFKVIGVFADVSKILRYALRTPVSVRETGPRIDPYSLPRLVRRTVAHAKD
jgi:hypothetical protein